MRDEKSLFSFVDEGGFKILFSYELGLLYLCDSQRLCRKTINKLISETIKAQKIISMITFNIESHKKAR